MPPSFRGRTGAIPQSPFPLYAGLGNHDISAGVSIMPKQTYGHIQFLYRGYSAGGKTVPPVIRVTSIDAASTPPDPRNNNEKGDYEYGSLKYSWDWDDLHLVQLHENLTGQQTRTTSTPALALEWLKKDLKDHARDGRPVILFQHEL